MIPPHPPDHDELYFGRTRRLSRHSLENVLTTFLGRGASLKINLPELGPCVAAHATITKRFSVEFGLGLVKLKWGFVRNCDELRGLHSTPRGRVTENGKDGARIKESLVETLYANWSIAAHPASMPVFPRDLRWAAISSPPEVTRLNFANRSRTQELTGLFY